MTDRVHQTGLQIVFEPYKTDQVSQTGLQVLFTPFQLDRVIQTGLQIVFYQPDTPVDNVYHFAQVF